jgi:hypothetical protein
MVTPVARGAGMTKLIAFIVTFAVHPGHGPLGGVDESVPGALGVTGAPDDGDAR